MLLERLRIRHRVHEAPDAAAAVVDGELARVTGVVRAIAPLVTSLLAARPCVAYRTRMTSGSRRRGGARSPDYNESVAVVRFAVEHDVPDVAIIEGSHALFDASDVDLPPDNAAREEHVRLLFGQEGLIQSRAEVVIEVGAVVSVVGRVRFDMHGDGAEHGFPSRRGRSSTSSATTPTRC